MHGHDHVHARDGGSAGRGALTAALALVCGLLLAEIVAGIVAGSLALLADAAHMLTDAAALGLALFAAAIAARPARGRWTYGFRRVEILAAQTNGLTLLLVGAWIVFAAIRRLISPPQVHGGIVLAVALAGMAVSLAAAALLARPSRRSLNVRGAFLHVATDLAAFAGTAAAGALILATGWDRFDPIASLAVAALIFWSSAILLRESVRILLEASPGEIDPAEVGQAIVAEPSVVEAHDLHVWTIGSGFPALSAHVLVEAGADCHAVRRSLEVMLVSRFGVDHTTLQVEHAHPQPQELTLGAPLRRESPLGPG
jgi:cobalt-zinc-cadmium efflux system protein